MARPKKADGERRGKFLKVRITDDEREQMKARAKREGMDVATLARLLLLGEKLDGKRLYGVSDDMVKERKEILATEKHLKEGERKVRATAETLRRMWGQVYERQVEIERPAIESGAKFVLCFLKPRKGGRVYDLEYEEADPAWRKVDDFWCDWLQSMAAIARKDKDLYRVALKIQQKNEDRTKYPPEKILALLATILTPAPPTM